MSDESCGNDIIDIEEECDDDRCRLNGFPFAMAAAQFRSCVLIRNRGAKCWGSNVYGQLGLEDTSRRGDAPGEMGEDLPTINLGTGKRPTALGLGTNHSCAILDDNSVKCWGRNENGQLGLGTSSNHGSAPGTMGDNLSAVSLGTDRTAVRISAGHHHSCAILDDATLKCWGANFDGQLGLGYGGTPGRTPNTMGDNLPRVDLGLGRSAREVSSGDVTPVRFSTMQP